MVETTDFPNISLTRYEAGVEAGMTPAESGVFDKVSSAAGAYLQLTEDEPGHPMEREEICHAFHIIQTRLLGRPTLRRMGVVHTIDKPS